MMEMQNYVIAAFTIGSALLWGYAGLMWLEYRALHRQLPSRKINGEGEAS
jgi:hypothetical protein